MSDNLINISTTDNSSTKSSTVSYIRILQGSPDAPNMDIYINNTPIASNFAYKELTKYISLLAGDYEIKIMPHKENRSPLIQRVIKIPENSVYTLAIAGSGPHIFLFPIPEPVKARDMDTACVRFIHLSSCVDKINIRFLDGTMAFDNLSFKNVTKYVCVPAGSYTFQSFLNDTDVYLLTIPDVSLNENSFYSIYLVTVQGNHSNLEAFLVEEPRY